MVGDSLTPATPPPSACPFLGISTYAALKGPCPPHLRCRKPSPPPPTVVAMTPQLLASVVEAVGGEDRIAGLPEELLALVFGMLGSGNCKHCSLVCCR